MKRLLLALSLVALTGSAFAQDWSKDLEKKAKQGDAVAQYEVGICYLEGKGVAQDYKKATKWLKKSMDQGNEDARAKFYSCYSKDLEILAYYFDDIEAQYGLGLAYLNGTGVAADKETAAEYFYKAKNNGHKEARDKYYSFESKSRTDLTTIYKTEGPHNTELTCELIQKKGEDPWDSDRTYTYVAENSYLKLVTGTDTLTGFVQGDTLVDATFKHGDKWIFTGNIKTSIAQALPRMLDQKTNSLQVSSFDYTFLASGILDYRNAYIHPDYNLPVLCNQVNFKGRLADDLNVYIDEESHDLKFPEDFVITSEGEYLIPLNCWKGLFPEDTYFGDFKNAQYGSYAYGKTIAKVIPGKEAEPLEYFWTLPNGGRIGYLNGYEDDVYFLPGSSEPFNPSARKGTITSGNNVQLTWDLGEGLPGGMSVAEYKAYYGRNIEETPKKLKVVTDKGVIIDITSNKNWGFLYETICYSIANGAKVFLSSEEAVEAGYPSVNQVSDYSFHILTWSNDESVTGTYTYADGRVEKIEGGKTESQIKEEAAVAKKKAAEEKKAYEAKCAKYGKVYVDAANEGILKVGMHFDLVEEMFSHENTLGLQWLERWYEHSDGTAAYHVIATFGGVKATIYIKNKKITDFTFH